MSTMANLKAEFHEHLTRPRGVYYDEEMNICLLESHLEMSKSHANVVGYARPNVTKCQVYQSLGGRKIYTSSHFNIKSSIF